jgi:cobaltochelatase CobT
MNRAMLLREKIAKLPVILSHTGVTITQEGTSAYVRCDPTGKPTLVNLPYIADNASEELMDAIEGFLDHEVAHLLFTDFNLTNQSRQEGFGALHGLLEDTRVEALMAKKFPGTGANLTETGRFYLRRAVKPAFNDAAHRHNRTAMQGILMAPALRAWGGQMVYEHFMRDYWYVMKDVRAALGALVTDIASCRTTADTYALAEKMAKALNAYDPELMPSPSEDGQDGRESEDEGQGEEHDGGSGGKAAASKAGRQSGLEYAPKFDDMQEGQAGTTNPDQAQPGEARRTPGHGKPVKTSGRRFYKNLDQHMQNAFDERLVELIGEQAVKATEKADYRVYSTQEDTIEPLHIPEDEDCDEYIRALESEVAHLCGPMQKNLERIIAARSIATWLPARRSGRLHAASLARLASNDARVFRKKVEGKSRDVAVELVVDCSGSMEGCKITLASQAAYALATVLGRLNIAHEVIGFTSRYSDEWNDEDTPFGQEVSQHQWEYARYCSLYMPILKGYNERMTANVRARFAYLPYSGILSENVDGECVEIAARRLSQRRETRKIMLVLSDGEPAADGDNEMLDAHLKKVVKEIEASGITVVGMGIDTNAVKYFYQKYLVIEDIDDLPSEVLKELKTLLIED